ncbi:hypothetical protein [Arenimonas oryziterrae]|uniref:Uncharacterized protein n=1 Tax=Arenimonas oryziterrae DSM 21050 = YC6267 TaxID=1121015 RepID=A0A091ASK3_9GAMM|nr:hypothetical protein [Arenimonas oryziterrae]KFN42142.1 hypothetical protein N789_14665 [Arenimonas oryziterrae DSM 21050 = YC6267]
MYACTAFDALNNCTNWVQQQYLLPPLSAEEGLQYSGAIIMCWFIALGIRELLSLIERK